MQPGGLDRSGSRAGSRCSTRMDVSGEAAPVAWAGEEDVIFLAEQVPDILIIPPPIKQDERSVTNNKPGPAQVGAISKAQKIAKRHPSVKYSFTVLENRKFLKKISEKITYSKKTDRVAR